MRIENWSVVFNNTGNPYTAPELITSSIMGKVYNHPKYEDGHGIITSRIEKVENGILTTHSGSQYKLGKINPLYLEIYPDALNMLK